MPADRGPIVKKKSKALPPAVSRRLTQQVREARNQPKILTAKGQRNYDPKTNSVREQKVSTRAITGKVRASRLGGPARVSAGSSSRTVGKNNPYGRNQPHVKSRFNLAQALEQLNRPRSAAAGFTEGLVKSGGQLGSAGQGAYKGAVSNKKSYSDVLPKGKVGKGLGSLADLILDPTNAVPAGKFGLALGAVAKAGERGVASAATQKLARRRLEKMMKDQELRLPKRGGYDPSPEALNKKLWVSGQGTFKVDKDLIGKSDPLNLLGPGGYLADQLKLPKRYAGIADGPRGKRVPQEPPRGKLFAVKTKVEKPLDMEINPNRFENYGTVSRFQQHLNEQLAKAGIKGKKVTAPRHATLQDMYHEFQDIVDMALPNGETEAVIREAHRELVRRGQHDALVSKYGLRTGAQWRKPQARKGGDKLITQMAVLDPKAADFLPASGTMTERQIHELFAHLNKLKRGG